MTWGSIAVVTRIGAMAHPLFFDSWSRLLFEGMREADAVMTPAIRLPAHRAANAIVKAFLTEDWLKRCDTLCMIDDDHVFPAYTLEKMRREPAGHEYDVLGAMYSARGAARWPVIMCESDKGTSVRPKFEVKWGWKAGDVVSVDALGLGFTMIRRTLLERMSFPYFVYWDEDDGTEYTEDVTFCVKARALGATLAIHTGCPIGHLDNVIMTPATDAEAATHPQIEKHLAATRGTA